MSEATLIPERVETLRKVTPEVGLHPAPDNGTPVGCEVELLSWAAGMPWSDSTPCISKVLAAFLRRWSDDLDEEGRARLHTRCVDRIEVITSTGGDGKDEARAWMATDWLVRVCAPAWLELAGVKESPFALRSLPPITAESVASAQPTIAEARKRGAAAWDAAGTAAWAAAGTAARAAADKKLGPTVTALQSSAFVLFDRMVDA